MTVIDASDLAAGSPLTADVVVIGSGPAGLTVALDLARESVDVLVVESGGRAVVPETRDLDVGDVIGVPFRFGGQPFGTADMRLRALGGASGHWAGMCRPLDPIDFEQRAWIPGSGWPIDADELAPWYAEAATTLQLGDTGWNADAWFARCGTAALIEPGPLETTVYQFSPPVRFATDFAAGLESEDGPRVLIGGTAVDVTLSANDARVERLLLRRLDGETFDVVANRAYVVAAGGLEVPRLLLAWGSGAAGVANSSGLVGVGYLEHPHRSAGQVRATFASAIPALYAWGDAPGDDPPVKVWAGWSPTPQVQAEERIGNCVALLRFTDGPASGVIDPTAVTQAIGPLVRWSQGAEPHVATVDVRTEQRPSANSRVTLGSTRDATGLPRVRVDWRPSGEDDRTGRRLVELLAAEFGRAGVGRVEVHPRGRPYEEIPVEIGCHPMGTARMSDNPAAGVVDRDLRTHDVANLYVCSSAVFPTTGHANPTLTIVALAHRLADHLM
jgi:choline dehydrogenase-like flavoprotein